MALLKGEGTHQILYGGADIFSGLRHNRGYLARPDHAGSFPAVLLVHGRGGLTSSVKSFARRLARHGLAVVAPDLFRGTPRRPEPPWPALPHIVSDVLGTYQWMASPDTPWVDVRRIGVLAFDRGAGVATRFTADTQTVEGLVLVSPVFDEDAPSTTVPTLGFYGKDDAVAGPELRRTTQAQLDQAEWILYGGAGHALTDEAAPDYRWEVAEDVVTRAVGFLARTIAT